MDFQVDSIWNIYPRTQTSWVTTGSWPGTADGPELGGFILSSPLPRFIRFSFLGKYSSDHFKIRHGQLLSMTL